MKKYKQYYDKASVRNIDSSKWAVLPNGFLLVPVTITRTGVFLYFENGKFDRRLRAESDVLDEESLKTLRGLPVTNDHPIDDIAPENVKKYLVGYVSDEIEIRTEEGITYLDTCISIFDKETQDLVLTGKKTEFSCGYSAVIVQESGIWNGEEYDSKQTEIRYNHGSIVERGRAGRKVKIRMSDSETLELDVLIQQDQQDEKIKNKDKKGEKKKTMLINGVQIKVTDQEEVILSKFVEEKQTEIKTLKDSNSNNEAKLLVLEKEKNDLQKQVDSLKSIDLSKLTKERLEIEKKAQHFLQKDCSEMNTQEMIKEVVVSQFKDKDLSSYDEKQFRTVFDLLEVKKETLLDGFSKANSQKDSDNHVDSLVNRYMNAYSPKQGENK